MKQDDARQDDITNNRRRLYINNYGNLNTAKERFELKRYEEEKDEDNLL